MSDTETLERRQFDREQETPPPVAEPTSEAFPELLRQIRDELRDRRAGPVFAVRTDGDGIVTGFGVRAL